MPNWSGEISGYLKQVKSTHDDDQVDRLNYVTTIYLLLAFALTIFAKNYVGEPLQCWVPNQWKDPWEAFAESYCFVENTYFVPMNDTNLPAVHTRENREMIYYQWVPFILSLMAFFFYLPRAVWRGFSSYSGLALSDMMSAARASAKSLNENKTIVSFAHRLEGRLANPAAGASLRYGTSLFNLYIVMKMLIWLNLLLQFVFLNHFLGTGYVLWGFGILLDLIQGRHWQNSGHFPRVAFCDLTVREMGNVNNWTVQCVLMVNMFNEKIFIFLWWWLAFVLVITTVNMLQWLWYRFSPIQRRSFVHLMRTEANEEGDTKYEEHFFRSVLKDDGVLVLRLLDMNAGRLQSTALFSQLWKYKFSGDSFDEDGENETDPLIKKVSLSSDSEEEVLNESIWEENYPSLFSKRVAPCGMTLYDLVDNAIHRFDPTYDVDTTDRIKYVYSLWIFCAASLLFFATNYVGQPLQCWVPNQFSGGWEQYAETYCFVESTYFVSMNDTNLPSTERREHDALRWYQWVPVILALYALFLYLPRFLWKVLQQILDINLSTVTVKARQAAKEEREDFPGKSLPAQKAREVWEWGRRLTFSLLATKIVSILVLVGQIFCLDWLIFGNVLYPFGLSVLVDMIRGRHWEESGAFPRVTFCDFEVREMGQVHRWSLQCVLMVNMFNEKVFVFVWWWLVFLLFISIINLVKWLVRLTSSSQDTFLQSVVNCFEELASPRDISTFRRKVLRSDGVTVLHLIEENATIYQAADYIQPLWGEFKQKQE